MKLILRLCIPKIELILDVYAQVERILDNDEECALYTLAGNSHEKLLKLNRSYSRPGMADKSRIALVKVPENRGKIIAKIFP